MPVTIDGTTGITTPAENTAALTVGSITGILKATSGVVSQAVAGTDYLTSTSGGTITLGTAQTASGTAVDFTGIPSWAKRVTVNFNGVSVAGSGNLMLQLGTSSGIDSSGYISTIQAGSPNATITNGFQLTINNSSAHLCSGSETINLQNSLTNTWCAFGAVVYNATLTNSGFNAGSKSLSSVLDRVRITTITGDTFDAGTINISYE
jgi:hypothetical protein